jgi:hypothetical protein
MEQYLKDDWQRNATFPPAILLTKNLAWSSGTEPKALL